MGALLGVSHPALGSHGYCLHKYDRMIIQLESEINLVHGRQLGPAVLAFHVQLAWKNWMVTQLDIGGGGWMG
jgi:hypothetical protein